MHKAIFLDRDGVINPLIKREDGRLTSPYTFAEFKVYPEVKPAIMRLKFMNYLLFVVTNQPHLYKELRISELKEINYFLYKELNIDAIRYSYDQASATYKPRNGMLLDLIKTWDVDVTQSYMIGDRWKDIVAGYNTGLKTIFIGDKYTTSEDYNNIEPNFKAPNLLDAVNIIMTIQTSDRENNVKTKNNNRLSNSIH